jgi:chromate transporter
VENLTNHPTGYGQLIRTFLRISLLGFGGPNAHLALMLDEVVDRKGWITREHFMHLVGITNLLPGPNSSEVAIHIGYTQRGWRGALATGLSFLLPTLVLVTVFSALYFKYGSLPAAEGFFWGLKPAILAVILAAGWKLGKTAVGLPGTPSPSLSFLMAGGILAAYLFDRLEVPGMVVGGAIGWFLFRGSSPGAAEEVSPDSSERVDAPPPRMVFLLPIATSPAAAIPAALPALGSLGSLFLLMLGSGAVLFGGGYMLVALLEPFVVDTYGWLTPDQFLDGIALTQAVPGPIVTLVAFVGFAVAGVPGAIVATGGIYLPSFAAVLAVAPFLERWRHLEGFRAALKGVNAVVAGAILGVGLTLLRPGLPDPWAGGLFLVTLLAMVRFKVPALWVVAAGLVAGGAHLLLTG